jgi:hypothetical protein
MHMTEEELSRIVEAKLADRLAARLKADRERVRMEVIAELRREEDRKWHERVNRKHPIEGPLAGLTPAQHQARLDAMAAGVKADMESMNRSNSKPIEGSLAARRADSVGGSAGFRVKPPGGA